MLRTLLALAALAGALPSAHAGAPPKGTPVDLAFVLLSTPAPPGAEEVIAACRRYHVSGPLAARGPKSSAGAPLLELDTGDGGSLTVMLVPAPVPKREADEAARFSVSSFGTRWTLPAHAAHLIVTSTRPAKETRAQGLARFTRLLAGVADASHAVGIYWGVAGATHDPRFFLSVAREDDSALYLPLWTGVSVAPEGADRVSLLSLGMGQLGLPDLLLGAPKDDVGEALGAMFDLLAYVVARGAPIPEGDTVGRTAEERLRVRYVPSPIDASERVWRVDLP